MAPRTFVLLITALVTLATLVKPIHIDDAYTIHRSARIADAPFDPSGFEIFWKQWPQPATESPWPLLIPYWIAGAVAVAGDRPWVWKLALFPFYWVFVRSLFALFQRFATRYRRLLVASLALSPTFLPGTNLMLDLPTMGAVLAALALFVSALDRDDRRRVLLAGLMAGLAAQCKYNGLIAFPIVLLYAIVQRRLRLGVLACAVGSALFWAWEGVLWLRYGESQFLWSLFHSFPAKPSKWDLLTALPPTVGATLVWAALLVLAIAPFSTPLAGLGALGVLGGFACLHRMPVEAPLFHVYAILVAGAAAISAYVAARGQPELREVGQRRLLRFLVAWLVLEIVGYIVISPFPAVRRTQGIAVVIVLLIGRSLTMSRRRPSTAAVRIAAATGILLGGLYYAIDFYEASVSRSAAEIGAERARAGAATGIGWFTGHWGFDYYARRAGLTPIVPDHTLVAAGERIVVPSSIARQRIATDTPGLEHVGDVAWDDPVRLSTLSGYYSGRYPLRHRTGPRFEISVYRALADLTPETPWPLTRTLNWYADYSSWTSSARAIPHLAHLLEEGAPHVRIKICQTLATYGVQGDPPVAMLLRTLDAPEPRVRIAAIEALATVAPNDPAARQRIEKALGERNSNVRLAAESAWAKIR